MMKQLKHINNRQFNMILISGLLSMMLFMYACEDTFEEDITDSTVELLAPSDSLKFTNPNVSFWWNHVDGARDYNIKIIQVDTNNMPIKLFVDSNLQDNRFDFTLEPGTFEWGVVAFNAGYETDYFYRTLFIDSTLDLSGIKITLYTPRNSFATNDTTLSFKWEGISSADSYNLKVKMSDDTPYITTSGISSESSSVDAEFDAEGYYLWTITGYNGTTGSTTTENWRELTVDWTKPNIPNILRPAVDDTIYAEDLEDDKIRFSWDKMVDTGSEIHQYNLQISTDSGTVHYSYAVNDTFYLWSPTNHSKLFWRINAKDTAQNVGDYSNWSRFFQD